MDPRDSAVPQAATECHVTDTVGFVRIGRSGVAIVLGLVAIGATVSTAVAAGVSLGMVVAGAVALGAAVWFLRLEIWQGLYAVTLTALIAGASSSPTVVEAAFYVRYVLVAALVVVTWPADGDRRVRFSELSPPVRSLVVGLYALVTFAAASTAWSYDPVLTGQQAVALGLLAALVHLLVTRRWTDPDRIGADLLVAYVVLVGAASAGLLAKHYELAQATAFNGRLQGVFSNPNLMGMALALAVPLGWGAYRRTRRPVYLLGLLPVLQSLVLSGSRTAQLGVIAAVLWLAVRAARSPEHTGKVVLGLLTGAGLLYVAADRIGLSGVPGLGRFNSEEGGGLLNGRTMGWSSAIDYWWDRPLQGWGYGAGEALFEDRAGAAGFFFDRPSAHNSYLQLLLELGLLGAVVMMVIFALVIVAAVRSPLVGANIGAVGVLVVGLAVHMTESAAFGTGQVYPFVYWPALAAALLRLPVRTAGRAGCLETPAGSTAVRSPFQAVAPGSAGH